MYQCSGSVESVFFAPPGSVSLTGQRSATMVSILIHLLSFRKVAPPLIIVEFFLMFTKGIERSAVLCLSLKHQFFGKIFPFLLNTRVMHLLEEQCKIMDFYTRMWNLFQQNSFQLL